MAQTDRINGFVGNLAAKAPCKVATTANITLSGSQIIDGVTLSDGDRVLVKDQTTASENGIYNYNSTGAWTRSPDFDGARDAVKGSQVKVTDGGGGVYTLTTSDPIIIGTTSLIFTLSQTAVGIDTLYEISDYQNNIATAVTAIGANDATLLIDVPTTGDTTVPENINLWFLKTGSLSGDVTIYSPANIIAQPNQQIFTGDGTIAFTVSGELHPEWFGADNTGAASSTSAFTAMIASGVKKVTCYPGGIYLLAEVALPEISNFVFEGNHDTFIPDGTVGSPAANVFSVTFDSVRARDYTIRNLRFNTDGATKGYATDMITVTQESTGYIAELHINNIDVPGGYGASVVKFVLNNTGVPEVLDFSNINCTETPQIQYVVHLTKGATLPSTGLGSSYFKDIYQHTQDVSYSVIKSEVTIHRSSFENIYGTGGAVLDLVNTGVNPATSESTAHCQIKNIYHESYYDDSRTLKGFYVDCKIDGLYLLEIAGSDSELFNGTMSTCNLRNLTHISRTGSYSIEFSANAQYNYVNDLFDYSGLTENIALINDAGTNNSFFPDGYSSTYTATITCSTSGTITLNGSYQTMIYTRKGNIVTFSGLLIVDSVSSPIGEARISLPFTSVASAYASIGVAIQADVLEATAITTMQAFIDGGTKFITTQRFEAGASGASAGLFKAGTTIRIGGSYLAKPDGT